MNDDEKHEVLRGHLDECLRHLGATFVAQAPRGSRGAAKARLPIAEFCKVGEPTVARWLYDVDAIPVGEPRLKMMYYLELQGYRVIELERMRKARRNFGELIAFGLLPASEAAKLVGYADATWLYQVLSGKEGASEGKEQKMWDAWKERKEELDTRKAKARERYRLDVIAAVQPTGETPDRTTSHGGRKAAVSIMEGLLALLEESPLDELPGSELAALQQTAGGTILRLSARLSALSSRMIMSDQRKGGAHAE